MVDVKDLAQLHVSAMNPSIHQPRSAIHEPPPASCGPTPSHKCESDAETAPVTPVRGPRFTELGSGKVAGKVLIVDHI